MKTSEEMLNKDIKKAFSAATPDLLGSVISSLDGSDGKVVSMESKHSPLQHAVGHVDVILYPA